MIDKIVVITVVVFDQDEALQWYTEKLGFEKRADQKVGQNFRWVTVAPPNQKEVEIALAHWSWYGECTKDPIGKNTVAVLSSSNCREDYETLKARGVKFTAKPKEESMAISAVFVDLYGNPYNLREPKKPV
jgi:uncharacterized glyoxalase superfamily protein PhnB